MPWDRNPGCGGWLVDAKGCDRVVAKLLQLQEPVREHKNVFCLRGPHNRTIPRMCRARARGHGRFGAQRHRHDTRLLCRALSVVPVLFPLFAGRCTRIRRTCIIGRRSNANGCMEKRSRRRLDACASDWIIAASSPPAKGRVERNDRSLVKKLRRKGIQSYQAPMRALEGLDRLERIEKDLQTLEQRIQQKLEPDAAQLAFLDESPAWIGS
jgi:hypothetical protein